jgi:hypothetical protein
MALFVKKSPGTTSASWASVSSFWVKVATSGWTSNGWTRATKLFVRDGSSWSQFWPTAGPYTTTSPYISTDTAGNNQPSGLTLTTGTTVYGQKGTWVANRSGYSISSYYYRSYSTTTGTINGGSLTTVDSGSLTNYASIPLTASDYDGKYLLFSVTATRSDGTVSTDTTDSNNYRYFVMRSHPPTGKGASTNQTSTLKPGYVITYTSTWNGTYNYLPDSSRSIVKWYKSTNGGYTTPSQIKANATEFTSSYISTNAPTNNGTDYVVTSTYTAQDSDIGYYIYVIDTQYNSNNDWNDYTGVSQSGYTGQVINPPTNTSRPYWQLLSGTANQQGSKYRLNFGSWSGSPTYYEYEIFYNDIAGTIITQSIDGTYTQNYVDYTFNTVNTKTISAIVYAGNSSGLSDGASATTSIGPITSIPPSSPTVTTTSSTSSWTWNVIFGNNTTSVKLEWGGSTSYGSSKTVNSGGTTSGGTGPFAIGFKQYWKATPYNGSVAGTPVTGIAYGIPYAPTGLSASQGSYSDHIHLSWNAGSGANDGYQIWYNSYASGSPSDTSGSYDFTSPTTSYDDYVSANTTRYYWVRSLNGDQFSPWQPTSSSNGVSGYTSPPAPGAFTYYISDSTVTPYWTSGAGINISGASNNVMTITWNAASNANSYTDTVDGVTNAGPYTTTNTSDTWGYSSSGYEYGTVVAYNSNTYVTISWTASSGAASYFYYYNNGTSDVTGTTTSTAIRFPVTIGNTATVYGISAWTGSGASGVGTGGTLSGSSTNKPTLKSTSSGRQGPFYLTYTAPAVIPTVSMSSTTGLTSSGATINWTSTNQSYAYVNSTYVGNVNSYTFTGLSASTTYSGTVYVYSSTGNVVSTSYAFTTSAASGGSKPPAPTVTGNNSLSVGGTFYWSSSGATGYAFSVYKPNGSLQFSTYGSYVTYTSFRPGYDATWAGAGTYTIYIYAHNSAGDSAVTTFSQYMS